MTRGFIALLVVVLLKGKVITGVITDAPLNAVAEVGGQAIFNCTSDTTLQNWIFARSRDDFGSPSVQNIALNCVIQPGFNTSYEVDLPGGSTHICNLIVKATSMQQAGIYTCTDSAPGPSAILTVVDSSPVLKLNSTTAQNAVVEGESVMFECRMNYNGTTEPTPTLRPYFYWTNSNGQNVTSFSDSTTQNMAVSLFTTTAQRGSNMTAYTCHVYFILNPPTTPFYVNNTPTVNISATSSTIEVFYYPQITSITSTLSPADSSACTEQTLTCTADANPPAQYEWLDLSNNNLTSGANKSISTAGQYQCIAFNFIRGQRYNDTKIENIKTCYYPQNTSITSTVSPTDNCVYKEETLTCTSDANPPAEYEWLDLSNNNLTSGANKSISTAGQYQCIAFNFIRGQRYNDTKIGNLTACFSPTNASISGLGCVNNFCTCLNHTLERLTLTCMANGYPEPTYQWQSNAPYEQKPGYIEVTIDGNYSCTASNKYGNQIYNDTVFISVSDCTNGNGPNLWYLFLLFLILPVFGGAAGIVVAICYCDCKKKATFNERFPCLEKMLPCMNSNSAATTLGRVGWIFVYIFMSITIGIVMIPCMLIKVNCCNEIGPMQSQKQSQEQSQKQSPKAADANQVNLDILT